MRLYIDGTLSSPQNCFLPDTLWFSSDENFDFEVNENTIRLDAINGESSIINEGNEFTCRWKGIDVCYIKDGEYTETEDITVKDLTDMINQKNMILINMESYYDTPVTVNITDLKLVRGEEQYVFDSDSIDKIEFF